MRIILKPHSTEATNEIVSFLLNDKRIQQYFEDKELILTVAPDAPIGVPIRTDRDRTFHKIRRDNNNEPSLDSQDSKASQFLKKCEESLEPGHGYRSPNHFLDEI